MRVALCFLASLFPAVFATVSGVHVVHERRTAEPHSSWALTRRAERNRSVPLRIGLTQSNLHELDSLLMAVSDPVSPTYGQHWSPAAIASYFAPSQESHDAVATWLNESGIAPQRLQVSPTRGWITLDATVQEVEGLLKTEYHVWEHSSGAEQIGLFRLIISFSIV
jgi:tripeptidyl-peptidase I